MKTVLITGGCGYIGSHIARAFKRANPEDVIVVIDRKRRSHTLKDIDFFYECDYTDLSGISAILTHNPGVIVHCAGTSLVGPSMENPAEYYDNNVVKLLFMLNVIKDMPTKPVILFSSSASVYGEPAYLPLDEKHPLKPISPYGNSMMMVEKIFEDYDRAYKIPSVCFRYFNAAGAFVSESDLGPPRDDSHIINQALMSYFDGTTFTINGNDYPTKDGTCVRDYIHVQDLAAAHLLAVDYIVKKPGAYKFNLGSGKGISNLEISHAIRYKHSYLHSTFGPRREGDPAELIADAALAKAELGWQPKHSDLNTIIDSAYQWYCYSAGKNLD